MRDEVEACVGAGTPGSEQVQRVRRPSTRIFRDGERVSWRSVGDQGTERWPEEDLTTGGPEVCFLWRIFQKRHHGERRRRFHSQARAHQD